MVGRCLTVFTGGWFPSRRRRRRRRRLARARKSQTGHNRWRVALQPSESSLLPTPPFTIRDRCAMGMDRDWDRASPTEKETIFWAGRIIGGGSPVSIRGGELCTLLRVRRVRRVSSPPPAPPRCAPPVVVRRAAPAPPAPAPAPAPAAASPAARSGPSLLASKAGRSQERRQQRSSAARTARSAPHLRPRPTGPIGLKLLSQRPGCSASVLRSVGVARTPSGAAPLPYPALPCPALPCPALPPPPPPPLLLLLLLLLPPRTAPLPPEGARPRPPPCVRVTPPPTTTAHRAGRTGLRRRARERANARARARGWRCRLSHVISTSARRGLASAAAPRCSCSSRQRAREPAHRNVPVRRARGVRAPSVAAATLH